MDGVFDLPQAARTDFLRSLVQSFGCTYVCLWQYDSSLSNRLFFLDGFYDVTNNQSSSSSRSVAERLFHQYRALTFDVNDGIVPGIAFGNQLPYLELQHLDLLRLTSTEIQTQFFQIAVFMGCKKGEIELGFSKMSQDDIQTAITKLFSEDFYIQSQSTNQNPHSSSSSSFISLSTSSPDQCSPLLLNIPGTSHSHFPETLHTQTSPRDAYSVNSQALAQVIPSYFPTPESEHEAIVRALLQVISSTSQEHQEPQQNIPNYASVMPQEDTAFKRYRAEISTPRMGSNFPRQTLQNRSLAFFRNFNSMKMRERDVIQAPRPISAQQHHHMITERRRREKLNQSFQALRALLPPGTKKNKVSILTTAKERIRSLMNEIEKLNIRYQQLMTVLSAKEATSSTHEQNKATSSNERLNVQVSRVLESSSSEDRIVDLQVTVRGECSQVDAIIRLLEFLERLQNVNLISMASNNHFTGGTVINQLIFRLRIIEDSEWDERVFQEAVRRVVADVIQWQHNQ